MDGMAGDLHLFVETPMGDPCLNFLEVGTGKAARRIAVRQRAGAEPALLWLGGFKSDMKGTKAEALDRWAKTNPEPGNWAHWLTPEFR